MKRLILSSFLLLLFFAISCKDINKNRDVENLDDKFSNNVIEASENNKSEDDYRILNENVLKIEVPEFKLCKREREDYNDYTPRTRYHVVTPSKYDESQLDAIADSLLIKEKKENNIGEIFVSYYSSNKKYKLGQYKGAYGVSVRIRSEASSSVFIEEENRPKGYNPPKKTDLSKANRREAQIWGASDLGRRRGYDAGYKDGKNRRKVYTSFDSSYPCSDEWIEQSYIGAYEVGYLEGFDDAGGDR